MVKYFEIFHYFLANLSKGMSGVVLHMLRQETRTLYENSKSYRAIPCVRDFVSHDRI